MNAAHRMPADWQKEYVKLCGSLRNARLALGLSRDRVSARIGASLRTFARWEAGETSPDALQLFRWADVVGVEITSVWHAPKMARPAVAE